MNWVFAYFDKIGKLYEPNIYNPLNVTGAGDALLASLVHCHLNGWSWDYSIKFSLITAEFALKVENTINLDLNEKNVLKILKEKYKDE